MTGAVGRVLICRIRRLADPKSGRDERDLPCARRERGSMCKLGAMATMAMAAVVFVGMASVGEVRADDGSIAAWGLNYRGQMQLPQDNTGFAGVSGGGGHGLALKKDGTVVAWGDDGNGQAGVPDGNGDFVQVAAGWMHSLALRADGSIVAWGVTPEAPSGTDFIAVCASMGGFHSLALRTDGSVVAWGRNDYGQCNVPGTNTGFVALAAGETSSMALRADGSIVAWGGNQYGERQVPEPNTSFRRIAAGGHHMLALKSDGSIVAWGDNRAGQCDVPNPSGGFVGIAAGGWHSLALRSDGSVAEWGQNGGWRSRHPKTNAGFSAVSAGWQFSVALGGPLNGRGEPGLPLRCQLLQNRPNPFTSSTVIRFALPEAGAVRLQVFDPAGRLVRTMPFGWTSPGWHEAAWDGRTEQGRPVAAGTYYYRLDTGKTVIARSATVLR